MSINRYWTKVLKLATIPIIPSSTSLRPFSETGHRLESRAMMPPRTTMTIAFMLTTGIVSASSPRTTCVQKSVIARIKM